MPRAIRGAVYIATETFFADVDGVNTRIEKGVTRVRAGHALISNNPQWWELVGDDVHFDVEQATEAPAEKRSAPSDLGKKE